MTEYHEISLKQFADLARESSGELGSMSDGLMCDYETGKYFQVPDESTALFLASSREIVLELVKRIQAQRAFIDKVANYEYHSAELGLLALKDDAVDLLKELK